MKLKNNALQELYNTLVSGNPTISPYAESPFDKAFRECDEKIQSEIDILKRSNETVLSANLDLAINKRKLEEEIEGLKEHVLENHKIIADISSERDALKKERDNLLSRTHYAEDEVERLRKAYDELFYAGSRKISELRRENEAVNKKLEEEVEDLKATLEKANSDRTELQKDRDFYYALYTELRKDYDKLFEDNKQIKNLRAELEAKVERMDEITKDRDFFFRMYHALKNDYKKLEAKYHDMKRYSNCYAEGYSDGKEEGEENLWDMLQTVKDMKPEKFDPECETLGDIIDMDLEDFLDSYKKWQEEKEKNRFDYMRNYLARFCEGRLCEKCPLGSDEYKCGNGYSFKKATVWDSKIIPDEELEKYYEKARGCGTCNLKAGKLFVHDLSRPMESINIGVTKACEQFCKSVRDADIKITENLRKGCTLEANVEVDKDLLEKVCGVKLDDE